MDGSLDITKQNDISVNTHLCIFNELGGEDEKV